MLMKEVYFKKKILENDNYLVTRSGKLENIVRGAGVKAKVREEIMT